VLLAPGGSNGATPPEQMRELGVFGELHPAVRERYDIQVPRIAIAEFELDVLIELTRPSHYATISRYPASVQDLAVVVSDEVSAAQVADLIRRGAGSLLESLELFDVYTGAQVGEGQRSLAYRLTFRAPDRTLTDEALSKVRGKVVRLLEREAGATLRG
jgi:phenylalanyl-tRNA synthetase beta chain